MGNFEPKKLDLIRIWEILKELKISYCCVNIFVLIIRPCSAGCSWSGSNDNQLCVIIIEIIVILSDGFYMLIKTDNAVSVKLKLCLIK